MQINIEEGKKIGLEYTPCIAVKNGTLYYRPDGKLLPGVTTIVSLLNNKPFLVAGSTKENGNYMNENGDPSKTYSQEEKEKMLMEAKNAYIGKSDEAKDIGKIVHELIEQHVKGQEPLIIPDEAKNSYNSFLEFEKAHNVIWLLSEEVIYDPDNDFCGTLDGLAIIDGVMTLVDHKTSKQIDETYYIQTAGYQKPLEKQIKGLEIKQRLILRIPKDGSKVEPVIVPTDVNFDWEVFINLRNCQRGMSNIKSNHSFKAENGGEKLLYKTLN